MTYTDMPTKDLLVRYNELAQTAGEPTLSAWKRSKSTLVDHIRDFEGRLGENMLEPVAEEPVAEEPVAEEPVAEEPVAEEPTRSIREASLDWLGHVDYYEDRTKKSSADNRVEADHPNARSVGLPYLAIIDLIKQEFPEAQTSVACLRWYSVKVRVEEIGYEGYELVQRRPRAKPSK